MDAFFHFLGLIPWWLYIIIVLALIAIRDIFFNKKHIITHNFPIVGHFRYALESIGPELRQYIVANNREELPFNRIERGWIYASAKNENNYEGFGTDRDIFENNYIFVNNALLPYKVTENHPNYKDPYFLPCAKVIGASKKRARPFRPSSVINVSAMSFGSLSARAIESMNKGCNLAHAYHNTGEGGLSPYHKTGEVPIHKFLASLAPTISEIRFFISFAALLVNVSDKILNGSTPFFIKCAIRMVSTLVLPDPAPAITIIAPSFCSTGARCASFNPFK